MLKQNHILVIRLSAMGDVAMTVPVLRALVNQHPNLKVTVLTRSFFTPFFKGLDNVEVHPVDFKKKHKGLIGLYKLSKEIKALQINAIADLHNVLRTKVLKFFLTRKKTVQLNKGRKEKKRLVTGKEFKQLKTTHQRYADVFKALGYPVNLSQPSFPKPKDLPKALKQYIIHTNYKILGIAPFAAHKGKMYPISKMEKVIAILSQHYNIILFGGGSNEIKVLDRLETKYNNVKSVAGKLSFKDELMLISHLDLMLSMDSGNAHIAAMFGKKVITIWGVTHPFAGFAPFNQPLNNALLANKKQYPLIPTSVYGNKFPTGYINAASSIKVDCVIEKVKQLLDNQID